MIIPKETRFPRSDSSPYPHRLLPVTSTTNTHFSLVRLGCECVYWSINAFSVEFPSPLLSRGGVTPPSRVSIYSDKVLTPHL